VDSADGATTEVTRLTERSRTGILIVEPPLLGKLEDSRPLPRAASTACPGSYKRQETYTGAPAVWLYAV
jgi:hypothetical protein